MSILFSSVFVGNVPNIDTSCIFSLLLFITSRSTSYCLLSVPLCRLTLVTSSSPIVSTSSAFMLFIAVTSFGATISIALEILPISSLLTYAFAFSFVYATFTASELATDVLFTFTVAFITIFAPSTDCDLYEVCSPSI